MFLLQELRNHGTKKMLLGIKLITALHGNCQGQMVLQTRGIGSRCFMDMGTIHSKSMSLQLSRIAVINSRNSIEILVSATNGYYTCHMSESADVNSRPFLSIDHQLGSHSSGGMLTPNFIKDGTALMDKSEFLLTAATNPEITWDNMTGNHAEVQISDSPDFKSQLDDFYFNSVVNSSLFTIGSTSGEMTIPV